MASIYNIPTWNSPADQDYVKNDIVSYGERYWYALRDITTVETPAVGSAHWGGVVTAALTNHSSPPTATKPHFFWKPSYGVQTSNRPRVKVIKYEDGYEQRFKDGIFNNMLSLQMTFDGRNEKEATAISHFLDEKSGVDYFFFVPPSPHQNIRKFICREWQMTLEFSDSYNISAVFEQMP